MNLQRYSAFSAAECGISDLTNHRRRFWLFAKKNEKKGIDVGTIADIGKVVPTALEITL